LEHLRFLVLDEADRLLGNAYQSWVFQLLRSSGSREPSKMIDTHRIENYRSTASTDSIIDPVIRRDDTPFGRRKGGNLSMCHLTGRMQRLLFSATLTDNPSKLAALGIFSPLVIRTGPAQAQAQALGAQEGETGLVDEDVDGGAKYVLPSSLSESIVTCPAAKKPITLLALLAEAVGVADHDSADGKRSRIETRRHVATCKTEGREEEEGGEGEGEREEEGKGAMCLVFASSVDTAHRLCTLLQMANRQEGGDPSALYFQGRVEEMSRLMSKSARDEVITAARGGQVKVIVCTDSMARGIDLPNVRLVVNYDPPTLAKTYVHRAGRTARALRSGHCVTLLKPGQLVGFRRMRNKIQFNAAAAAPIPSSSSPAPGCVSPQGEEVAAVTPAAALPTNQIHRESLKLVRPSYEAAIAALPSALLKRKRSR
jgi:ATP-dependent RNA helicase DDX51/DBP6